MSNEINYNSLYQQSVKRKQTKVKIKDDIDDVMVTKSSKMKVNNDNDQGFK